MICCMNKSLASARPNQEAEMAAVLHASLHAKLLTLPGEIEIFSGYQAGSVCGDEERQKLMAEHMQTMR